jgi:Tol biopolymer transport system component
MKTGFDLRPLVLCFFLALPLALSQNEPAASPFAGETAWIAYQTFRGVHEGVWLIHPDGTGDHRIATDVDGWQMLPDWSPDGTRIAFATRGGATEPIYEYDLRTGVSRELFACEEPCVGYDEPAYSPDGSKVALILYLGPMVNDMPSDCALAIGDVATGEVVQITSNTEPQCDREYFPRWSADGSQLTYWRDLSGERDRAIFVIDADGSNERRLTDPEMLADNPDWSPDGDWIVFSTNTRDTSRCCTGSHLYRMRPDGSGMEQLTHFDPADARATQPRYTPDGQYIVFTAMTFAPITKKSLWAIPAEGGEPIVLAPGGIYTHGTWQPQSPRD